MQTKEETKGFGSVAVVLVASSLLIAAMGGYSAYHLFGTVEAAVFATVAVTLTYTLLLMGARSSGKPEIYLGALAATALAMLPFDIAGMTKDITYSEYARTELPHLEEDYKAVATVVALVRSKSSALPSVEVTWRSMAEAEDQTGALGGNGPGRRGIYFAIDGVANSLSDAGAALESFLSVADSELASTDARIKELRALVDDGRKDKTTEMVRTRYLKLQNEARASLRNIIAASNMPALDAALAALSNPMSGAQATTVSAVRNEILAMRKVKQLATAESHSLSEIRTAVQTGLPSEVVALTEPSPLERVLRFPGLCLSWLVVAGSLHLAQILTAWHGSKKAAPPSAPFAGDGMSGKSGLRAVE